MSRRERILRLQRTLTRQKHRKPTSNNVVRYSINYQSLMSGEGGKGIFRSLFNLFLYKCICEAKININLYYRIMYINVSEMSTRSRKIIRLGTVLAYVIVVSLGAIILSLYYCYM